MRYNDFIKSYKQSVNEVFKRMNANAKKVGLVQMTPPPQTLLLDPKGRGYAQRQQMYHTRAGIESGRYKREKNEKYRNNYITALSKLPNQEMWIGIIGRIMLLKTDEDIWNVLPPLKDWYPQKRLFKGSSLPSIPSYKGETDIDLLTELLYNDLNESLELNGV